MVQIWHEMETNRLSPGLDSYVIMIHGFLEQECLVKLMNTLRKWLRKFFYQLHSMRSILKDLLNSLLSADKLEMSKDVWNCIMMKGCELNVFA